MLAKWKTILTNWINCYPKEPIDANQTVNVQSLLNIISHLRENFCLDESKSSILEAHTLNEFIVEKYPEFIFENGNKNNDSLSEEELYIVASLLLLFVCVNSKDMGLKNAMCSKLSSEDQETILKFSKCLMECSAVSYRDVENAILESCGQDTACWQEPANQVAVAETPPALRSLHGEVRRLSAALEAERFDRNYLQEELARTQVKIDKLVNEKDQYKRDILELKAQISCGDAAEAMAEGEGDLGSKKMLRQLEDVEQRLVDTRAQLDELIYERDTYRAKVDDLKLERDKWLAFGQQETSRAVHLAKELEQECKKVESLRELVAELRQHNRHNDLDGSQLECDNPDVSIHSLGHNMSICNEVCANVVEIQLSEERAQVTVLREQIEQLQAQLDALNQKTEKEKLTMTKILKDKESEVLDLKHRVNEEIEEKNSIKTFYSNEVSQLNNEINELEQKMRADNDNYSRTLEAKMKDIQTIQEEKLTLLQSLSDETTKLENFIKERETTIQTLTADLNNEMTSKQKLRDDYENRIMKLNEKVLNRNNELVELQNNVFAKSEMIESVNVKLRGEQKSRQQLDDYISGINEEISRLNLALGGKDDSLWRKTVNFELSQQHLSEKCETVENLRMELQRLNESFVNKLFELQNDVVAKGEMIESVNAELRREKESRQQLDGNIYRINEEISRLNNALGEKDDSQHYITLLSQHQLSEKSEIVDKLTMELQRLKESFVNKLVDLQNNVLAKSEMIESVKAELNREKDSRHHLNNNISHINKEVSRLSQSLGEKDDTPQYTTLSFECSQQQLSEKCDIVDNLTIELQRLSESYVNKLVEQQNNMVAKNEMIESVSDDLRREKETRQHLDDNISRIHEVISRLNESLGEKGDSLLHTTLSLELSQQQLSEKCDTVDKLAMEMQRWNESFVNKLVELQNDVVAKNEMIESVNAELRREKESRQHLDNNISRINEEVSRLNQSLGEKDDSLRHTTLSFELSQQQLSEKCETVDKLTMELQRLNESFVNKLVELQNNLLAKNEMIESVNAELRKEKESRQHLDSNISRINEEVSRLNQALGEKDGSLRHTTLNFERSQQQLADKCATVDNLTIELQRLSELFVTNVEHLEEKIFQLVQDVEIRDQLIRDHKEEINTLKTQNMSTSGTLKEKDAVVNIMEMQLSTEISVRNTLQTELNQLQDTHNCLIIDYNNLNSECSQLNIALREKNCMIEALNLHISDEKAANYQIMTERDSWKLTVDMLSENLVEFDSKVKALEKELSYQKDEIREKNKIIQEVQDNMSIGIADKNELSQTICSLNEVKVGLVAELSDKSKDILLMKDDMVKLRNEIGDKKADIEKYKLDFKQQEAEKSELQTKFYEVSSKLTDEIANREKKFEEFKTDSSNTIKEKDQQIHDLQIEIVQLKTSRANLEETLQNKVDMLSKLGSQVKQLEITKKESENKSNIIKELENKNKQLLVTIDDHNSRHELLSKEKDAILKRLQIITEQLSSLETDYSQELVMREKLNTELKNILETKDKKLSLLQQQLEETKELMEQNMYENANKIKEWNVKILTLIQDKEKMAKETSSYQTIVSINETNINELTDELAEEKRINKSLYSERETLINERNKLKEQLLNKESVIEILEGEFDELTTFQTSMKQLLKQEKHDKKSIKHKVENLIETKEKLSLKLMEELASKELLASEKECIDKELNLLKQKLVQEEATNDVLSSDKELLSKQLREEIAAKEKLVSLNKNLQSLHQTLKDQTTNIKEEKDIFAVEKENLLATLNEEKAAKDSLESEKHSLELSLNQHVSEINNNQEEIKHLTDELCTLKDNFNVNEKSLAVLTDILNSTTDKVVTQLKSQDLQNDHLRKLISSNSYRNMPNEQCNLLMEIADNLSVEITTRQALEEALQQEKNAMKELTEQLNKKEMQLEDITNKYKNLQQSLNDNQLQSSKQNLSLQEECKALNNELTDIKLQLEIKVHSLKEKLVDNEHLTDKLKKSYECQIDNLNVMSNKLTNYLKDKSAELDAVRKEKDKLQHIIEENNKVIKTLEEEVKSQTANQEKLISDFESERLVLKNMVTVTESVMEDLKVTLEKEIAEHVKTCDTLQQENMNLKETILKEKKASDLVIQEKESAFNMLFKELSEDRLIKERLENDLESEINNLKQEIQVKNTIIDEFKQHNQELIQTHEYKTRENDTAKLKLKDEIQKLEDKLRISHEEIVALKKEVEMLTSAKNDMSQKLEDLKNKGQEELMHLQKDNVRLVNAIEDNKEVITKLEQVAKATAQEFEHAKLLRDDHLKEKLNLVKKCSLLEQHQAKTDKEIDEYRKEITTLQTEINTLRCQADGSYSDFGTTPVKRMAAEQKLMKELGFENMDLYELKEKIGHLLEVKDKMVKESEGRELVKMFGQSYENWRQPASSTQYFGQDQRDNHKVDISPTNFTQSSDDSNKTISDLEKIIHDRNRTITTLQSDITYIKTLMADSENKLLDVTKELEVSKENCQQLSGQLKKLVLAKNEEIADMKKQMSKMSVAENRASQIIKVSAKYQAIILKRIAEIKSNTVLKELTNFGNGNVENDIRRSLAGNITMEDLENFLETTDRHLKRCSEKQIALQKERDRLSEVNRINESEIINMKKFLTELSVSFKTFSSVKDLYTQKLSRVVSLQRTVRREMLNLDGQITDAAMCRLERGYTAVMQDLAECIMNLERWVERSIARTISPEKIKQAYSSEIDRASISSGSFLNTSMEIQLDELEKSFQKVLEEVARAAKGEGARDSQSVTVMEVRAEYEDKLNRMKAKMKQLYQEQITIFREKQKEEISVLERELEKAREKLAESSRSYEEHIRGLTTELWNVGEKFLMKKDEAEWLRRKRSGSLQSLQHVHSSGLLPREDRQHRSRPSDACSMRSLPVHKEDTKSEARGLHMSDEEGEVFDNRWLATLNTPRRHSPPTAPPGARLSELRWRNSLCLPHLKSSYPVETQFAQSLHEEDIKVNANGNKSQRKEVGITAYKKPGPPTPSKQAGRLSATDSELRESLRSEPSDPPSRKTSTPSRLRALFRSSKTDNTDGTPRSRRLSIFRSKK